MINEDNKKQILIILLTLLICIVICINLLILSNNSKPGEKDESESKNGYKEYSKSINEARKNAFADEIPKYIQGAEKAYIISELDGDTLVYCYTIGGEGENELNNNYVMKIDPDFKGKVILNEDGLFKEIYLKNSKFMIIGVNNFPVNTDKDIKDYSNAWLASYESCEN